MSTFIYPTPIVADEMWSTMAIYLPGTDSETLTVDECMELRDIAQGVEPEPGRTSGRPGGPPQLDVAVRDVDVFMLLRNDKTAKFFDKFLYCALGANNHRWKFDLTHVNYMKVLRYGPGQHYIKHLDLGQREQLRKLSVIVQLSNPDDYEGGQLLTHPGAVPQALPKDQGSMVVFPSWLVHEVQPVESGERWTCVLWIEGPPFR